MYVRPELGTPEGSKQIIQSASSSDERALLFCHVLLASLMHSAVRRKDGSKENGNFEGLHHKISYFKEEKYTGTK